MSPQFWYSEGKKATPREVKLFLIFVLLFSLAMLLLECGVI